MEDSPMAAHLHLVEPRHENRTVPVRPANAELRQREYLTEAEVEKLIKAAKDGRYGHRDATLILIAFRHGLRAIEVCDLEWSQVEFGRSASLHVRRAKNGKPSVHPLRGDELRALRELRRQFSDSAFVFTTERGGPFTADAVNRLVKRIGERASRVHAHMLRHACGYALANRGHDTRAIQDWLGHRARPARFLLCLDLDTELLTTGSLRLHARKEGHTLGHAAAPARKCGGSRFRALCG
jgi:integrase